MKKILVLVVTLAFLSTTGCASLSNTEEGAAIGAAAGALLGGLIGKKAADKPTTGIIVGAAVGGTAGAIIGRQMDKQAEELDEALEDATVERVGEGIMVTFDSAILFATNSADLSEASKASLGDLANSLVEYPNTDVIIAGHTDATGSEEYNQQLSERRAESAALQLLEQGVPKERMSIIGYGEMEPVASNDDAVGRSQNRRVEIAIYASEEFQEEAAAAEGSDG